MTSNKPLVSIVVITYNSSAFILETLESIKNQTYKNIELIISDDCSTDKSVSICQQWIKENNTYFKKIELITTKTNTGLTKNLNRGFKKALGEWIKPIAGDDILLEDCIEENLKHSKKNNIIFSKVQSFSIEGDLDIFPADNVINFFSLDAQKQFERLYMFNFLPAASMFLNTKYIKEIGYFDERNPMMEDYPLWLKSTYLGNKLHFFPQVTVKYRVHNQSLSNTIDVFYSTKMHEIDKILIKTFNNDYKVDICLKINKTFEFFMRDLVIKNGNDRNAFLRYQFVRYFNPCKYFSKIQQILKKDN